MIYRYFILANEYDVTGLDEIFKEIDAGISDAEHIYLTDVWKRATELYKAVLPLAERVYELDAVEMLEYLDRVQKLSMYKDEYFYELIKLDLQRFDSLATIVSKLERIHSA